MATPTMDPLPTSLVREYLNDQDNSKYVPKAYGEASANKFGALAYWYASNKFEAQAQGQCLERCFKHLDTPVVTESENECMLNCVTKTHEVEALAKIAFLKGAQ